ncbi:hypothetical protein EW146_g5278 [Bondarzewia mesenterica]|uniref:Alpha/beta hydrolase fold-3 domain-containing protein n=1 Tax=Bondarzewia mesenterica TaxID=1095465 RepID=A0A4S4LT20_9AGAM|nr:hypothetical protein EW146_g5278 [Bondarzewia mesenterica]
MDLFTDLPYVSSTGEPDSRNKFHEFDLYIPRLSVASDQQPPLVCFIHGGAWRSEDKAEHSALARSVSTYTGCPVAVPNYRLTPREPTPEDTMQHPAHAEDILQFLTFVLDWPGPARHARVPFDPSKIYLMGHSCGAHMLSSIFLDSTSSTPSLTPPLALLSAVQGIALSEGIYDIDLLLSSFPDYRQWFIANTFGEWDSYVAFSTANISSRKGGEHIRWLIIHSKGDTLVDQHQSEIMYNHLLYIHKDASRVLKNWEDLEEEHNAILRGDKFVRIVGEFMISDGSRLSRLSQSTV